MVRDYVFVQAKKLPGTSSVVTFPALKKNAATTPKIFVKRVFEGVRSTGFAPPDPSLAIGKTVNGYVVQAINGGFAGYRKSGATVLTARNIPSFWRVPNCWAVQPLDSVVLHDIKADRWVISQMQVSSVVSYECIAVSTSNDPTGSWY